MPLLLDLLRASADVVIIDSPPMLPIADTAILASLPLGVVVVAESDRTSAKTLSLAREALERAQARILGIIVNKAARSSGPYYSYHAGDEPKSKPRRPTLRILGGA
jgi:Mrp family chromosome partitioning ATPase